MTSMAKIKRRGGAYTLAAALALPVPAAAQLPNGRLVDLTYPFDETTVYWPTEKGFVLEKETAGVTDKGYYYASNKFSTAEHGGTHMDAPLHFHKNGQSVDEVPLERLIGKAVVVDVSEACVKRADYQIPRQDLLNWEKRHGHIPAGAIVLLRTGFGRFWPDLKTYLGTAERGPRAVSKLHFPGLSPIAAAWLAETRKVAAVGIDTASIDYGQSKLYETHQALFAAGVPAFENVANLEKVPETGATVIALPMKIRGGTGAPLRIVAVLP
jgi:kynurenine formamidase